MSKRFRYIAILLFCWSGALASAPSVGAFETMTMQLQQRLQSARRPAGIRIAGEPLRAGRTLQHFYEQRAYQPAWNNAGGPSLLADYLIESLVKLEQEGLDPHDYHFRKLEMLLVEARQSVAPDVADKLAKRLTSALEEPYLIGSEEHSCAASIGLALYPTNANTLTGLMREADQAMYRAKARTRGNDKVRSDDLLEKAM